MFTTKTGKPFGPDRMTRLFRKLVAASGLPPVTLHGLRHGAATLAQFGRRDGPEGGAGPARPLDGCPDRQQIRRGGYTSREEAEHALSRLQVTGGRALTVADWLGIWLATRAHMRDKTLRGYTAHVCL